MKLFGRVLNDTFPHSKIKIPNIILPHNVVSRTCNINERLTLANDLSTIKVCFVISCCVMFSFLIKVNGKEKSSKNRLSP